MNETDFRESLMMQAIEHLYTTARELLRVLEDTRPSEDKDDDELCSSEGFERLHGAMKVYADQFKAYEDVACNGFGTVTVEWKKG